MIFSTLTGSSTTCSTTNNALNNRYCGMFLSNTALATTLNLPICGEYTLKYLFRECVCLCTSLHYRVCILGFVDLKFSMEDHITPSKLEDVFHPSSEALKLGCHGLYIQTVYFRETSLKKIPGFP